MAADTEMPDAPPPPNSSSSAKLPHTAIEDAVSAYRPVKIFRNDTTPYLSSLDFDSSGAYLVSCTSDETLHVYDTLSGTHHKECFSKKYGCHLGRFTHNTADVLFASTKVDDAIRYLSTHTQSFHRYFKGHTAPVTSITMSPGDDTFLSSSLDNTVRLWDFKAERAAGILNLTSPYLSTYDPSASVLAVASTATSSILLYDKRNFDKPPFATFEIDKFEARFPPPQRNSGGGDATTAAPPLTWSGLEFSNDGKHILLSTTGAGHFLLNAFDGELVAYLSRSPDHRAPRSCRLAPGQDSSTPPSPKTLGQSDATFSPDGRWVVSGSTSEGLLGWDTAAILAKGSSAANEGVKPTVELPWKMRAATVRWNPRWHMLASGDKEVVMWTPDRALLPEKEEENGGRERA